MNGRDRNGTKMQTNNTADYASLFSCRENHAQHGLTLGKSSPFNLFIFPADLHSI